MKSRMGSQQDVEVHFLIICVHCLLIIFTLLYTAAAPILAANLHPPQPRRRQRLSRSTRPEGLRLPSHYGRLRQRCEGPSDN